MNSLLMIRIHTVIYGVGTENGVTAVCLLTNQEAFDVYLAPNPAQPLFYRLTQGANAASRYDALNGRITDVKTMLALLWLAAFRP